MAITYITYEVQLHKEQEYISFSGGDGNGFWDMKLFHVMNDPTDNVKCTKYIGL